MKYSKNNLSVIKLKWSTPIITVITKSSILKVTGTKDNAGGNTTGGNRIYSN